VRRPRRRDDEIGLADEESRQLHQIGNGGDRFCLLRFMEIGADRNVEALLHFGEHREALFEAGSAIALDRRTVRFIEACLEDEGKFEPCQHILQMGCRLHRQADVFQHVEPGNAEERLAIADRERPFG